jgi:FkbM family methyltransferase
VPRYPYRQQRLIDAFSRELDRIETTWPMTRNYQRLDPYIVPYVQGREYYEMLIYHVESKSWFDLAYNDAIVDLMIQNDSVASGDVVFDVGSNSGAISIVLAALCGDGGHVHAFDPYPWNALATRANCRLNGLDNVTAHPVGLSNRDFEIMVSPNDSRIFAQSDAEGAQRLVVHDYRRYRHLAPRFLKLDIEGSEHDLFADRDPAMFASVRTFVLEFHPFWLRPRGIDPRDSLRQIEQSGFSLHYHTPGAPPFEVDGYADTLHLFWGKTRDAPAANAA